MIQKGAEAMSIKKIVALISSGILVIFISFSPGFAGEFTPVKNTKVVEASPGVSGRYKATFEKVIYHNKAFLKAYQDLKDWEIAEKRSTMMVKIDGEFANYAEVRDILRKRYEQLRKVNEDYFESNFLPILDDFTTYICQTSDQDLLKNYLNLVCMTSNSADEARLAILAQILLCQPDMFLEALKQFELTVSGQCIYDQIDYVLHVIRPEDISSDTYALLLNHLREKGLKMPSVP
ncbi:hypothetical protein MUP29_13300 [bacterium]|nr:hypothetical protein [bacterium]